MAACPFTVQPCHLVAQRCPEKSHFLCFKSKETKAKDYFPLLVYKHTPKLDNYGRKSSVTLIDSLFYEFRPTTEDSDPAAEGSVCLNCLVYQYRKMLLPGYKYLQRSSLGAPRLASPTAVRFPSLRMVVATASRL